MQNIWRISKKNIPLQPKYAVFCSQKAHDLCKEDKKCAKR